MTKYTFFVSGTPRPKQRPRRGANGHFYTPTPTKAWEAQVAWAFKQAHPGADPLQGDCRAVLVFQFTSKTRSDLDNLTKAVLDALNGLAYEDDKQVSAITATRQVLGKDSRPGVVVTIQGKGQHE